MPNTVVEGLFLLAFWLPTLAVAAGGLLLVIKIPARTMVPLTTQMASAPQ